MLKRKQLISLVCCLILILSSSINTNAYTLTLCKFSNQSNIKYAISSTAASYSSYITQYAPKWATYCPQLGISAGGNENIYFYGNLSYDNGAFATTIRTNDNYYSITFYSQFQTLTASQQYETIVHEVGHTLGLDHCQSNKETISVMRATGFNGKAYPLSDDIAGINVIYK